MNKHLRIFSGSPIDIKLDESSSEPSKIVPSKVQVLRCGKFSHHEYGEFEITPEVLKKMKANFDAKSRGVDLAIDYSHESEKVAAGWIKSVELSEDEKELWLEVEWTPKGQKVLSDKEFRYLSADFTFDFVNNENKKSYGPTLYGAGLTNRPAIKEMKPILELQEQNNNGGNEMDPKDQKIAELEAKIKDLLAKQEGDGKMMGDMQKKLEEYEVASKKAAEEKVLAEKKEKFKLLLSEKKAVPAQEEAFLSGDMLKFAELSQPVKLNEDGHGHDEGDKDDKTKNAQEKVYELAEKLSKEKNVTFGEAVRLVFAEKPDLKKAYQENK